MDFGRTLGRLADAPSTVVVIPICDGGEGVARCLRSVLANSHHIRILAIDDASTDQVLIDLLDEARASGLIDLIRHERSLGYTATINRALEICGDDDVILLGSDTEVGPLWHQRLRWVAYSLPHVSSVTAASDHAGAGAFSDPGLTDEWPRHLATNEIARMLARRLTVWAQAVPAANTSCVYLRRKAVDAVGPFDPEASPRDYGEQTDWSIRAESLGFTSLLAPHVFVVRHARSQRLEEREALAAPGHLTVPEPHPDYAAKVRHGRSSSSSHLIADETAAALQRARRAEQVRPRRLYVLHRSAGGTPDATDDLIQSLADDQDAYLLESLAGDRWELSAAVRGSYVQLMEWQPSQKSNARDRRGDGYAVFVAGILASLGIEAIHVSDRVHTPLMTLPEVARRMGIGLIYSSHDVNPMRHHRSVANEYRALYEASRLHRPVIGILDAGVARGIPATAHIRVLRRALTASSLGLARFERVVASDYASRRSGLGLDALLIARNGLGPEFAEQVLDRARSEGVRVVLDIDDDLVSDHAVERLVAQGWDVKDLLTLRGVIARADHVLVSTPELERAMTALNPSTGILPNALDPRLWCREIAAKDHPEVDPHEMRVLYMGSQTHSEDLELLDGVFERVSKILDRSVTLEVVGITGGVGLPTMRRIQPRRRDYAGFTTWLRRHRGRWHAAVAPLQPSEFNRHKSDLKLLEYAMLELSTVASDFGPYAGQSVLASLATDHDSWVRALCGILDVPDREGWLSAREHVRDKRLFTEDAITDWLSTVTDRAT